MYQYDPHHHCYVCMYGVGGGGFNGVGIADMALQLIAVMSIMIFLTLTHLHMTVMALLPELICFLLTSSMISKREAVLCGLPFLGQRR